MSRALLVLRHEVYALLSRRSFWMFLLGVPLLGFIIYGGAAYLNRPAPAAETQPPFPSTEAPAPSPTSAPPLSAVGDLFAPQQETRPQGYIDQANLLVETPGWMVDNADWVRYSDPAEAAQDLARGTIGAYYVIPPDYIQAGRLLAYTAEYNLMATQLNSRDLIDYIQYNLFDGDEEKLFVYWAPFSEVVEENLAEPQQARRDASSLAGLIVPYAVTSLLMMSVIGSATLLLNGLAEEKVNRTIETLLVSISPRQILMGKITGLGLVGLLQAAVWGGLGFLLLRLSGQTFTLSDEFALPASVLAWGALFFLLGYLLYAAMMAGVGALVPGLREASQVTFVISLPLMTPYFLLPALVGNPNGWLATALSMFPLTAPTSMVLRLSAGAVVPVWQVLLSAGILALSSLVVIRIAARMFRAQTIMSGQKFGVKSIWRALVG